MECLLFEPARSHQLHSPQDASPLYTQLDVTSGNCFAEYSVIFECGHRARASRSISFCPFSFDPIWPSELFTEQSGF